MSWRARGAKSETPPSPACGVAGLEGGLSHGGVYAFVTRNDIFQHRLQWLERRQICIRMGGR
jgi:hypothetical protein